MPTLRSSISCQRHQFPLTDVYRGLASAAAPIGHLTDRVEQLSLGRGGGHLAIEEARLAIGRTHQVDPISQGVSKTHPVQPHSFHGAVIELVGAARHHNHRLLPVGRLIHQIGDGQARGQRRQPPTRRVPSPPAPGAGSPGIPTGVPGSVVPIAAIGPIVVPAIGSTVVEVIVNSHILLKRVIIKTAISGHLEKSELTHM